MDHHFRNGMLHCFGLLAASCLIASCHPTGVTEESAAPSSIAASQGRKLGLVVSDILYLRAFRFDTEHLDWDGFVEASELTDKAPFAAVAINYAEGAGKRIAYNQIKVDNPHINSQFLEVYAPQDGGLTCQQLYDAMDSLPGDKSQSVAFYPEKVEPQHFEITGRRQSCCAITRNVAVSNQHLYDVSIDFSVDWSHAATAQAFARDCIAAALDYPNR